MKKFRKNIINKKNNYIKIILIFMVIISLIKPVQYANAEDDLDDENILYQNILQELEEEKTQNVSNNVNKKPTLNSRRYVVFDRNSKKVIYGKDENKQTAMASTTKIMTAIVVLENCKDLNEIVTISKKAANTGGSTLGINTGDKITVENLLYGLLLRSGNDTAVALAEHFGGSIEGFSKLMNQKAKELGLTNTNFVTPHGLDDPNHYTTATELAYITDYALQNEKFRNIVKTQYKTITINDNTREIKNTNELLLSNVEGVYGVKTGFTNNAGRCLVTAVKRNNMDLIIVVLGADTRKDRAKDSLKLIEYVCKEYRVEDIESLVNKEFEIWNEINKDRIYINKGKSSLELKLGEFDTKSIVTNKELSVEINTLNYLEAPIEKESKIGVLTVKEGDTILEEVDIKVAKTVERRDIIDYFYIIAKLMR